MDGIRGVTRVWAVTLATLVTAVGAAGQPQQLEDPAPELGDRWEYRVVAELGDLLGLENATGSLRAEGPVTLEPISSGDPSTLRWRGSLSVTGNLSFPGEGLAADLRGSLDVTREEAWQGSAVLPARVDSSADLDLEVTAQGLSVSYRAELVTVTTVLSQEDVPTYPVAVGDHTFQAPIRLEANATFALGTTEVVNRTTAEVTSRFRLTVREGGTVEVPAGAFPVLSATTTVLEGVGLGPLQDLLPGTVLDAAYAEGVGEPVRLRYLVGAEEVGTAALQSYVRGGAPPWWRNPFLLVPVLVVPVAVLIFLARRERRRGL